MPRRVLRGAADTVFHVMNRGARCALLFETGGDYARFERVLAEAADAVPMRLLTYVVMPNHWHLVLWPATDGALSRYMQWLTRTHVQRWHLANGTTGTGALYQGRYKAIPVQADAHFLTVCRYVERNPVRAGLVDHARAWRWSGAWAGSDAGRPAVSAWPVPKPNDWPQLLEMPDRDGRLLRRSLARGLPYGGGEWAGRVAAQLQLEGRLRGRGRPSRRDGRGGK